MADNFQRLLEMMRLIPLQAQTSAAEVHRRLTALGFTVSRRTVERDLESLARMYPLECDRRERPYGWRWAAGNASPLIPHLGLSESMAMALMRRELGHLIPGAARNALEPWFAAAEKHLKSASPGKATRWMNKIAFRPSDSPLRPAPVPQGTQDAVNEALFTEVQIDAQYRRAYESTFKPVRLHPLGQVRAGLVSYLVACFDGFDDPRLLALHRLRRVQLRDERVQAPARFELGAYLDSGVLGFGSNETIKLRLRMERNAAMHLYDTPLSKDQIITQDAAQKGMVLVSATVHDSQRLEWWIRGFGDAIERLPDGQ